MSKQLIIPLINKSTVRYSSVYQKCLYFDLRQFIGMDNLGTPYYQVYQFSVPSSAMVGKELLLEDRAVSYLTHIRDAVRNNTLTKIGIYSLDELVEEDLMVDY